MIVFLEGELDACEEGVAWININGVGYGVEVSAQTVQQLPATGTRLRLLTYHHITDSDERLFGFFSTREKALFEYLITVKGVGPKLGLTILSGMDASLLAEAIVDQDIAALSRISGIGKKTAERIVLELKDKILASPSGRRSGSVQPEKSVTEEAISALEALGFKKRSAEETVRAVLNEQPGADVSIVVKEALKKNV